MTETPRPIEAPALSAVPGVAHGFFTRAGGVSGGLYRGLNVGLGSRDDRAAVIENRARVTGHFGLPPERLATVHQVHSPDVVTVTGEMPAARPEADALVTATPGIVLGVLTADCGPLLFADGAAGVVGAAHAGWKGVLTGVIENTVEAMIALGAKRERIVAVLGPSIMQENYEVGPEFVARFLEADAAHAAYFRPSAKPGHSLFDLPGLTVERLARAGISGSSLGLCTYADPDRFFSYRRTTHAAEPDYGRQISTILVREH